MYSITRSCAKGELDNCGCDMKVRQRDTKGKFEWGGCSENTKYGAKFSRKFVDTKESTKTATSLMNLWNNEAGRKVGCFLVDSPHPTLTISSILIDDRF